MTEREKLQTGQKFGKLTVMGLDHTKTGTWSSGKKYQKDYYKCLCECNNACIVEKGQLKQGKTRSCGCLRGETVRKKPNYHGLSKTKIYSIWSTMKDRCLNPKNKDYKNYGGRGIQILDSWTDFKVFYQWAITNGYKEGLTIERMDVNGNYEEKNCKWIENELQSKNKRDNRKIEYNGIIKNLADWAREFNIGEQTIGKRLDAGWSIEKSLTTPPNDFIKKIKYQNKTQTVREWAKETGLKTGTILARIREYNWTIEEALTTPIGQKRKKKEQGES